MKKKSYTITEEDLETLCEIARCLCDIEHEDYDYDQIDLWQDLADVIENIKG